MVLHLQFKTGINETLFEHEKRPLTRLAEELLSIFVLCSSSPIFFLRPTWHIATLRSAGRLSAGVETFHQLVVVTELHSVCLVPATPGENTGSRPFSPVVGHNVGTALIGIQGSVHATPVANGKDVHLLNAVHHGGWPMLALVAHSRLGWDTSNASVVAIAAGPQGGVQLMPCKAIVAGGVAATSARWHAAKFVLARRGTVVEPLEIRQGTFTILHSCDAGHVVVPTAGTGVILAAGCGPFHHLLAWLVSSHPPKNCSPFVKK